MVGGDRPIETDAGEGRWRVLLILIPLGLLFGYGLLFEVTGSRRANYDEHLFVNVAQGVLRTGLPVQDYRPPASHFFDHTPLYSYFIAIPVAIGNLLGGSHVALARVLTAAFGLGTVVLVFLTARDVRGPTAGFIAGAFVALNPYWIRLSWFVHMEVPMTFFLVAALYLLVHRRLLAAGVAVAVAVLLKEIAIAFWLAAATYVVLRHGARRAAVFALPTVVALVAWFAIAAAVDLDRLTKVMDRWVNSAGGSSAWDGRFRIGLRRWTRTVLLDVLGLGLSGAAIVTAGVVAVRRRGIPAIAWLPAVYSVLVVAVTYAVRLKEDRWLASVIPMLALSIAMLVDWVDVAQRLDRRRPADATTPPPIDEPGATGPG